MTKNSDPYLVAALYKFAPLTDLATQKETLDGICAEHEVKGILLLASEGINGTIAGSSTAIHHVLTYIRKIPGLEDLEVKTSHAQDMPFLRMKVRLKREIVTMGVDGIDPNVAKGIYVEPEDWNALIKDPDVLVIDTRNDYEVQIGTFERAQNPKTQSFREFPDWVRSQIGVNPKNAEQKKIAMFCTGGIRCEKATALLRAQGLTDVYHLKGGILKYLEVVPEKESLWRGQCFVFDRRVSVGQNLEPGPYKLCSICREPILSSDGAGGGYANEACSNCRASATEEQKQRAAARQHQIELAEARGAQHLGPPHTGKE